MQFEIPAIDSIEKRLKELDEQLSHPDIFKDSQLLSRISKEHQRLYTIVSLYNNFQKTQKEIEGLTALLYEKSTDEGLKELAKEEISTLENTLVEVHQSLLLAMIPPDPSDSRNTILEIRAGIGGEEAALFAGDLFRMYLRFAENKGWKVELLGSHPSETGGFREISFLISGENVYKTLKFESGGHRVQRVPTTEANGRIHTSSATVAVLPEAQEIDVAILPDELEISVCRASGPGGQGVNTTDSAVQILHKPSGLIVTCADERSQQKNKVKALKVLRARLLKQKEEDERKKYAEARKQQVGTGDRSDRIRTYNFTQNRVTDHRIGLTLYNLPQLLDGDLKELLNGLEKADQNAKLEELLKK